MWEHLACLPFNAVYDGENYDRVYKAEDWAWYFATFIANGIFPKPSDGLQVIAYSGMEIKVNAGFAFINGYAFKNPASHSIRLDMAEGALNRVDRVVVRWDLPQRDIYIAVLKGTPSAKPQPTAVTRATWLSQHYERTEETAVLGVAYIGNSYLANTF